MPSSPVVRVSTSSPGWYQVPSTSTDLAESLRIAMVAPASVAAPSGTASSRSASILRKLAPPRITSSGSGVFEQSAIWPSSVIWKDLLQLSLSR